MSDASGEHLETERKYETGSGFRLPDLSGLPGVAGVSDPRTHRLTATYFDTADLRLAAARVTLRRRTGGTDAGWHLKLPAGGDSRREVRLPPGRSGFTVPGELAALAAEWTGGEPLLPVARLRTTRIVRFLTDAGGQVLAEVADDRVSASRASASQASAGRASAGRASAGRAAVRAGPEEPSWEEPVRWREVEVELVAGDAAFLDAAGRRLAEAGAAPARSASKLQRLLGPAQPAAAG